MKQFLELSDIPRILDQRIKECGGIEKFAEKHGLNATVLESWTGMTYDTISPIPEHLERSIGLKRVTVYERIEG